MFDLSEDKTRQLIKISTLYYMDGLSQQEIAERYHVSRPQISRMISMAKKLGIVNISIKNPYAEEHRYEHWISEHFSLLDTVVASVDSDDHNECVREMGRVMTALLDSALKSNSVFGVMAGTTIHEISENIHPITASNVTVVPMVGGIGTSETWQANLNVCNFGTRFNSPYMQLNAPAIVSSCEMRDALLQEPHITNMLDLARQATTALVGIGQITSQASIIDSGFLNKECFQELSDHGAIASLCNSFLDADGNPVRFSGSDRMIGLTVKDLRQIPKVIGVAYGPEKVDPIIAALKGRWIDILVTTRDTAKEIVERCTN